MRTGHFERGVAHGVEAVARLEVGDDPETTAFGWINLGANRLGAGNCQLALEAFSRASAIGDRTGHPRVQAMGCAFAGLALGIGHGEFDGALGNCKRAVGAAPDPYTSLYSHWALVLVAAIAKSLGVMITSNSLDDEAYRRSVAALEVYADGPRDSAPQAWVGLAMSALSEVHLSLGSYERARGYAVRAFDTLLTDEPTNVANVLRQLARAELALGRLDASQASLRQAREHSEALGARLKTAFTVSLFAELAAARSDHVGAASCLGEAYAMFDALGLPFWGTMMTQFAIEHALTI